MAVIQALLDLAFIFYVLGDFSGYPELLDRCDKFEKRFEEIEERINSAVGSINSLWDRRGEMKEDLEKITRTYPLWTKDIKAIQEKLKKQEEQLADPSLLIVESLQELVES